MGMSLIYRNRTLYELAMLALYGRYYSARYEAIADLIPRGADVLDLCCGPATLYHRYLKQKNVTYRGLDINHHFVTDLVRRGISAEQWDLRDDRPLPRAGYVIMQASLYHFLPDAERVLERMLVAAGNQVIVAEPIKNLSSSKVPLVAYLSQRLTDSGAGAQANRFVEQTLDELAQLHGDLIHRSFLVPGGREKVYVFEKVACVV